MPCKICNTKLIDIHDYLVCPKCEKLTLVPYEDSLIIADFLIKHFNGLFFNQIKKFNKIHILQNIFWQREKQIRGFYNKYSTIKISRLLACNLLLHRIIQMDGFENIEEISEQKIEQIIRIYEDLAEVEEERIRLEAGNTTMIKMKKYDLNHLTYYSLENAILVCYNENYDRIVQTFARHNIMSAENAEAKMKEWSKVEISPVIKGSNKSYTPEETIIRFYELISTLYISFTRNRVYLEAFGIPSEGIKIDPLKVKILAAKYPIYDDKLTVTTLQDFRQEVGELFGRNGVEFKKNFVLSTNNLHANPLFLEIDNFVLISQTFTELYSYMLLAILSKNIFDRETIKHSKEFESRIVKDKFEEFGFRYIPNRIVKNKMEIDGIAISNNIVYVIEVKGWGARRLLEEKSSAENLKRDIHYAIDGWHLDHNSGNLKKKVSLLKKIHWVNANRHIFNISPSAEIRGLLVISEQTPIPEYNGCLVRFVNDLNLPN